ncbi:hypothetical protein CERSUDRAFT_82427 [Gelatoporia subvermispora B]|uniref:Peptide hydrolase n=1 Tax=Ceriporiopsis subvermispora (strain B) TaxID=914234 RepID=M2PP04_CERS8|nr:hypothetical protein CERSUDRAFT_82427 [Gelatoporia subvermispora B]
MVILCLSFWLLVTSCHARSFEREFIQLPSDSLSSLISSPDPVRNVDPNNPRSHLSKILIPRPSGSENNTMVKDYIVSTLQKLDWHVEEDTFSDSTPYGVKQFTNVIATKDPSAPRRVVVAAHFDSKFFPYPPQDQFVGATDSAAPCAFLLDLAETLDPLLNDRQERYENGEEADDDVAETTLQLVFFDGEEAFKMWTATDSIYGARHLAQKWATTYISPNQKRRLLPSSATEISTIEHFILLDLLGAPHPVIRSSFIDTAWLFDSMVSAERRLAEMGAFVYGEHPETSDTLSSFFTPRTTVHNFGGIEDDHIPFLSMGVSVLHIIAVPFPTVWHTIKDDATALDVPTMRKWNLILRVFMSEYLGLRPEFSSRSMPAESYSVHRSADELGINVTSSRKGNFSLSL